MTYEREVRLNRFPSLYRVPLSLFLATMASFRGVNLQLALRANYTVNLLNCVLLPGIPGRPMGPDWEPMESVEVRNRLLQCCFEPRDLTPRAFSLSKSTKFCGFDRASFATVNLVKLRSGVCRLLNS
jgi:hypothetical protein